MCCSSKQVLLYKPIRVGLYSRRGSQVQVQDSRRSASLLLPSMSRSRSLSAKSSGFETQWQTRRASEGKAIEKRDAPVLLTPNAPLTHIGGLTPMQATEIVSYVVPFPQSVPG